MTKNTSHCQEMSVKDYQKAIENDATLKKKLQELGIVLDNKGLSIPLGYTDLLTEEERVFLKNLANKFNSKYEGNTIWHVKFGEEPGSRRYCYSDVVCDHCYKSLLKVREHNDYMKS